MLRFSVFLETDFPFGDRAEKPFPHLPREEAAAACLRGCSLADEIAALAELTVDDANALMRTALREENRAYVQIDPQESAS